MVLKNKDGSVYILHGPNPLVKEQDVWDRKELIFHNFKWDEIIYSKTIQKTTPNKDKIKQKPQEHVEKVQPIIPKKDTSPVESKEKEIEEIETIEDVDQEKPAFEMPLIRHKVLAYCLPAKTKKYSDNFYGEFYTKTKFGKKFIFPFVMIESRDLFIQFWTSDPNKQIEEKSIVYPFSYEIYNSASETYDRVPYDEYRWWEISKKEFKDGGWLFEAIPSSNQPDFSD